MGDVYLAEDTTLKRKVALKILPANFAADPERLRRFRREAEALAALNHPNIVTVHSVETASRTARDEKVHFLTMELVEGASLDKAVPKNGLSLQRFFALAVPLAEAMAAAHDKGIIHRDLKPGNVMVGTNGTVKVVDFGLAKSRPRAGPEDPTELVEEPLTQAGSILGTLPYMSPEQLEGRPLDGRSDVFSLGVILFEMATGQRPFKSETSASLIAAIMSATPAQVDTLRTDLPHHLARIIRHCLEKDPNHRFQTARDVSNELTDLRDELVRDSGAPATRPRSARSVSSWMPAAILGAFLLGLGGWLLWRGPPARQPSATTATPRLASEQAADSAGGPATMPEITKVVVLPFDNIGPPANDFFATGITDEITSRLAAVSGLGVISRTSARQYRNTEKTLRQISNELGVGYVLEGSVHWSPEGRVRVSPALIRVDDGIHLWGEVYDRLVDEIFDVQTEIALKVVHRLGVALLDLERTAFDIRPTQSLAAYQAFLKASHYAGQPHFSIDNWKKVLANYEEAVELDPDYALAWAALSRTHARFYYLQADRSEERKGLARKALERARKLAPNAPEVHLAQGYYFMWVERDSGRALDEFDLAQAQMPNSAELLAAKGTLLRMQGHWSQSERAYERAFELSPREASIALELAYAYWPTRQYEKALAACEQTIALGPAPDWQAWAHLTKAFNYWSWKGADPQGRAALEFVPIEHSWSPWTWFWQEVYEGKYAQALARLDAIPNGWIQTKIVARPAPLLAALVHDVLGERELSEKAYTAARRLLEAELESAPEDPRLHSSLGIAYAALGQRENAVREGERAVALFPLSEDAFYGIPYVIDLAMIHTLLGNDSAALDQIELLLKKPSWISSPLLEVDPRWNRLRDHPRFAKLLDDHRAVS